MTDILARIDAATGCQQCTVPLGDSPSDDFCSDGCQADWHETRAVELAGYREPLWDLSGGVSGIRTGMARMDTRPWRLPRQTGNLTADHRALQAAIATATTDAQRAACAVRAQQLVERHAAAARAFMEALRPTMERLSQAFAEFGRTLSRAFGSIRVERPAPAARPTSGLPDAERRAHALDARRNRNTGPQHQRGRPGDFRLVR